MSVVFKKILFVYLLVLILGASLSAVIYSKGHSVSSEISLLVNDNLPRLNQISKLRAAIFAQKPLLYEYYASIDHVAFLSAYDLNQREIEAGFYTIHSVNAGASLLQEMRIYTEQISKYAGQLAQILTSANIDWDSSRDILARVSEVEGKISPLIDELVRINQQQVHDSGESAQVRNDFMIKLMIGFSLVISIISLLIGYQVNAYILENAERKRLAMFPESNPSPVMRMTWEGKVVYSNPATRNLLDQLQLADPIQLLPENFMSRLIAVQAAEESSMELQYTIKERVMDCAQGFKY
jgi:hypothetical protein